MTETKTIATASFMHFLVDALCVCCLYISTQTLGHYVAYNVLAFLTQPIAGLAIDKATRRINALIASSLLLGAAVTTAVFAPGMATATVIALGIGNSLFHAWGGREVAFNTRNDIRALGIYVAPGAMGLAVGAVWANWALLFALFAAVCALTTYQYCTQAVNNEHATIQKPHPKFWIVIIGAIMLFVAFRSYLGGEMAAATPQQSHATILLAGFLAMLGKAMGGFISHNKHIAIIFAAATIISVACWAIGRHNPATALTGLFFINCTMPITLFWANKIAGEKNYGLSFGLLAASLVPPYLFNILCH